MPETGPLVFRMIPGSAADTSLSMPERRNNGTRPKTLEEETLEVSEIVSFWCPHCKSPMVLPWGDINAVNGAAMKICCSMCCKPVRFEYGRVR